MSIDPRTPVVVGVAQALQRPDDPADAVEALALMEQVVRDAADDAGAPGLLSSLDVIGVVQGAWKYTDPARLIADRVGATNVASSISANGGNTPQSYLNHFANRITAGDIQAAAFCGAETIWSRRRQRRAGLDVSYTAQPDATPDERFGADVGMQSDFEQSRGMSAPIHFYPLFESAIRNARGETLDEHRDRVSALWETFNQQAVANDYAWFRTPMTADEIRNPSPSNRMIGFPYTKSMNSNWDLDQAAAVIVCSAEAAEAAGVPRDRWVFPHAGTDAHDTYTVSNRRDLYSSPAINACGKALFELGETSPDEVAHIDLYSCFPSAVQVGAHELGIGEDRLLTQTGGLTFAGGPLNNYVTHSIATMIGTLRDDPGAVGLVSGNGGFLTKHSVGLYSTEPSDSGWRWADVQDVVDQVPETALEAEYSGDVTVEAYTVMHSPDGPEVGLCAVRTPDGGRTWGQVTDLATAATMTTEEAIGRSGSLDAEGVLTL
ncbi:MAG: acetyl-CoA acetyltransferase [Actinomycetota bacterium]